MNIEQIKKINPNIQDVENTFKELNDKKVYKYWHNAWQDFVKPMIWNKVGYFCGKEELKTQEAYDITHDYFKSLSTNMQ